jgi:Histidine kinase-like ATPase domain
VETRDGDVGDQIDTLHTQACTIIPTASSLDQAADSILSALLPYSGEPADDVTLLLVRTPGAPKASAGTMIHPGPQHVAGGRRFVRDTLHAWNQAELAPTACLLVSELLTNAMRHTSEPIGLRLHHTEHEIIAEISDDHPQLPRRTLPAPADEDGRGLTLVEALADRWGSLPANGSKIVWFALATDGSAGRERYLTAFCCRSDHPAGQWVMPRRAGRGPRMRPSAASRGPYGLQAVRPPASSPRRSWPYPGPGGAARGGAPGRSPRT